jgi:hypothetical protein
MSLIPTKSPFDILAEYYATNQKHVASYESTKIYDELRIHADGEYPKELIDKTRPSESREIKEYRKSTYQPHTKPIVTKIISSLYKIRRSQDWSIQYGNEVMAKIGTIPVGEELENYCENMFPYFGSITHWMFNVGLKNYLIDPNGLVAVIPLNSDAPSTEMYKPYPTIFNSNKVIDFVMDEYAVVESVDTMPYKMGGATKQGKIFYIFDKIQVVRYVETYSESENRIVLVKDMEFVHNMGELPVFQFQGQFRKALDKHFVFESRIAGIIPRLNEFATMWSDFKAEVVQHVHSTRWVMATQDCTQCNGTGNIIDYMNNSGTVICPTCKGKQKVFTSPYENLVVVTPTNANSGENPLPSGPPAGYIQKDGVAEMTKTLNDIIKEQAYYALSAINMEFLAEAPLSQSGVAKEVDRDELNNFVHAIAEDIIRIMDDIYYFVNEYRYSVAVPNPQTRRELLPEIAVPEKFDLLSTRSSFEELKVARDSKINSIIITQMELDIARKRFSADDDTAEEIVCTLNLDPFPGKSMDEITSGLTNGGINKQDFVIWCNLNQFVKSAIAENEEFTDLPLAEQKTIIAKMADEMLAKNAYTINPAPYMTNVPKEENEPEETGRPLS